MVGKSKPGHVTKSGQPWNLRMSLGKSSLASLAGSFSSPSSKRSSVGGRSSRSPSPTRSSPAPLALHDFEPTTLAEMVTRDAHSTPSWRQYHIQVHAYKMLLATDRAMPMAPTARSPRHLHEHTERFVPPTKPKAPVVVKVRKEVDTPLLRKEVKRGPCDLLIGFFTGIGNAIMAVVNGFLEQDLEVQIIAVFLMISAGGSAYTQYQSVMAVSGYAPGMAPPAPPIAPDVMTVMSDSAMDYATTQPIPFLLIDFGGATIIGIIVLFWEDIKAWNRNRIFLAEKAAKEAEQKALEKKGYEKLGAGKKTLKEKLKAASRLANLVKGWKQEANVLSARTRAREMVDPDNDSGPPADLYSESDLRKELLREGDRVEELQIKLKVHTAAGATTIEALEKRLTLHKERQGLLKEAITNLFGEEKEAADEGGEAKVGEPPSEPSLMDKLGVGTIMTILKNSATGFISVFMFFADVASDIAVIVLLWDTGNKSMAISAAFFLVAQFFVMYFRVLPYMNNTFGGNSFITITFTIIGFPVGLIVLDFLMLLEPFGLLPVLPLPAWLKQFVPACERARCAPGPARTRATSFTACCSPRAPTGLRRADKATRVITEIVVESLPQSLLQSYILIIVVQQVNAGTASPEILALAKDASAMPKSIAISTLAIVKTWMEIVQQSREAGISVSTKASQLWHVGAGLPLDALKKGSIVDWACSYSLDKAEVPPLVDALIKNTSLSRLNLAESGMDWDGAEGNAAPLAEAMNTNATALSGLKTLIISKDSNFEIPIAPLRAGVERALEKLETLSFFAHARKGAGPWHADIMLAGDLLRNNMNRKVVTDDEKETEEEVVQLLEDARGGAVSREVWEKTTKRLMAVGNLRRSQLQSLAGAECLRDVGFTAEELIACKFTLLQLRNGRYTVTELKECGVGVHDLCATRYPAEELHEGGVTAAELKPLGYQPGVLREGGFTAAEVRAAKYPLADLKGVYTASELLEAEYPAVEMRRVGFEVADLKAADWRPDLLRKGGYTATEMRAGGYDASQTRGAGYSATEATVAGWSLEELKAANYDATGLRKASHTAAAMREAGFTPSELRAAKYPSAELYKAGFGVEELRKAGVPIAELTAAGATIAEMRESGISAGGLKNEKVKLKDMRGGGYTPKEVKAAGYSAKELRAAGFVKGLHEAGYTIEEAVAAKFSCEELFTGGYTADELLAAGFKPLEMRAVGFDAKALQAAGVTLPKLRAAGVSCGDLRSAGFACDELRQVGVVAKELFADGVAAAELKEAGYLLADLRKLYPVGELRDCGFSCEELREVGFTSKEVSGCGATNRELRDGGYTATEMREIGLTAKELKLLQYSCADLKTSGFNAKQLATVGFVAHALKVGGFRARHIKDCGFKGSSVFSLAELKADGFRVPELRHDEGFTLEQMSGSFSVKELRIDGDVTAAELLDVGYSLIAMREGGFNATELYKAGYGVLDMKKAGFTCLEVREAGFVEGIKSAGYSCKEARAAGFGDEIKRAGYEVPDLKAAGCTFAEVKLAGFTKGIKAAGYTCKECKLERFKPGLLRGAGFNCKDAMNGGYSKELKAAHYTVQEARAAGCTIDGAKEAGYVEGLKEAGYTIAECFDANYPCKQALMAGFTEGFKAAGYTPVEASVAGFTPQGIRTAGYNCEDFRMAEFSCKQAKEAGYCAKEAREAGWTMQEMEKAGYVVVRPVTPPPV